MMNSTSQPSDSLTAQEDLTWTAQSRTSGRYTKLKLTVWTLAWAFLLLVIVPTQCIAQPGGGPDAPDLKILDKFDADGNGVLNKAERAKARASLQTRGQSRQGRGGPPMFGGGPGDRGGAGGGRRGSGGRRGPGGSRGGSMPAGKPGPKVSIADAPKYPDAKLYDANVLRTLFLEFEQEDWEQELQDFKPTDVEVPATLTVDGKVYPNVGVSFRGASSFFTIPSGSKRSINLSLDYLDGKQRLYGHKTLNLLNGNGDASFMSSYLYSKVAGEKIATPQVNFVKVVINGRSWGVYASAQQFNKVFIKQNFGTGKGTRWKVSGSPRGDAGLRYLGERRSPYESRFEIKSKDNDEAWKKLIQLCKVLNKTPADKIEAALEPMLDIDGVLWFLATDVALINSDGYWTRASDYNIYLDPQGTFHILPHDMNEAFRAPHGPGGSGGPDGGRGGPPGRGNPMEFFFGPPQDGVAAPNGPGRNGPGRIGGQRPTGDRAGGRQQDARNRPGSGTAPGGTPDNRNREPSTSEYSLDPLVGLDNDRFPLRSKLLANEKLRTRYLQYVRIIARDMLAWENMGPTIKSAKTLIDAEVKADTRKLMTYEAFVNATNDLDPPQAHSLREFCEERSKFLLNHEAIKSLPEELVKLNSEEKSE